MSHQLPINRTESDQHKTNNPMFHCTDSEYEVRQALKVEMSSIEYTRSQRLIYQMPTIVSEHKKSSQSTNMINMDT